MSTAVTQVPSEIVQKWQEIVNTIAEVMRVPSALIMKVDPPYIKVFVSSESNGNPYERDELAPLNTGLYCETVMKTRQSLLVPDALRDDDWKSNPDIKLGMISYLGFPVTWPDGKIFGTICVLDKQENSYSELYRKFMLQCRDVLQADLAALARLSRELTRSEAYLEEAQRLSHTGSFGWNVKSGEIFWSDESYRIFGYEPGIKPTLEMTFARVHPEDAELVRSTIEDAACHNTDFDYEHRLKMPDGAVKHLHIVAHATKGDVENPQFIGAVMDITARKVNEEVLRQNEERYGYLFEHMPIALWSGNTDTLFAILRDIRSSGVTDIGAYVDHHPEVLQQLTNASQVIEVNRRAIQIFGARTREELLGPALTARFWGTSPQTYRQLLQSRFSGKRDFESEAKFTTLDGRTIQGLFFVMPYPSTFGTTGMVLAGFVDDTDRLLAQEKLRQVQSEFARAARISTLGELTASIAHEVNQPLTAITTNSETVLRWLERPEPNVAKVRQLTQRVVEEARRATAVIARIRAMASGRVPQFTALSLHDVINDAVAFLNSEIGAINVSISLDLVPTLPKVSGDRIQLQQVVANLVINAAQAMTHANTARRIISIQTTLIDERTIGCAVEDSGPGIDPQYFSRLFDSFYTTKDFGMGLGLPVSRSIIEAHHGELRADNKSNLGGARFSFTLPVDGNSPDGGPRGAGP